MKRNPEQIRTLVLDRLATCKLVIWGYTEPAKQFYLRYKEIYNISVCVTEQVEHPAFLIDESQELPIIDWNDYTMEGDVYILVFARPFVHIENQILAYGLRIFEEYIDSELAEYMLSEKKIAIVAGNCQIVTICDFLKQLESFTNKYILFRFSTHYWKSKYSLKSLAYLKNVCDLYICMQHEEDDIHFFSIDELPETCEIVRLPNALCRLYWPQLKMNFEKAHNEFFLVDKKKIQHGPFEYGDLNINEEIKKNQKISDLLATPDECALDEMVRKLSCDDYYSESVIQKHINMVLRGLEYSENGCDITISDFIKANYKKVMLYRDMAHMQPVLIWEIVKRILKFLKMDTYEVEMLETSGNSEVEKSFASHCTEIPVYPSVAKHMDLQWCNQETTYDVTFYNGIRKLTFEEYVRSYYYVCSRVYQIMKEW